MLASARMSGDVERRWIFDIESLRLVKPSRDTDDDIGDSSGEGSTGVVTAVALDIAASSRCTAC